MRGLRVTLIGLLQLAITRGWDLGDDSNPSALLIASQRAMLGYLSIDAPTMSTDAHPPERAFRQANVEQARNALLML
jgi:hypothetical protein